nr:hypothetical protein [Tanacetum cinerariifolium]
MHGYTTWWEHGETEDTFYHMGQCSNSMKDDEVDAATHMELNNPTDYNLGLSSKEEEVQEEEIPNKFAQRFYGFKDNDVSLYAGCQNWTKLQAATRVLSWKSDLNVPVEALNAKKCSKEISLPIKKIYACKKHCMLFYDVDASLTHCRWCGTSRYKSGERKVPNLVLTYMPIADRLQMLYMSEKTAKDMTWHADHKTADGHMVHPSDGRAWKNFNLEDPLFAHEISNVRLGLCTDGFSVDTNDAYRRQNFKMKAILLWTVSDFMAYAMLHNLDVMQIEKNVFKNIVNTVMDTLKTKDNIKARMDIEKYCDRAELHVRKQNNKVLKIKASYTFSKPQVKKVCEWLKYVKFPDGYASNIGGCVNRNDSSFYSFKSHECHVFMQQLLPIALKGMIPNAIWDAITELCTFFHVLCSKELHIEDLETLKYSIVVTLCKLEKVFPPGLFDSMEHLVIHLVNEAINGGTEQYMWMYLYERKLGSLKRTIRNRSKAEGSIVEAHRILSGSDPRNEHLKDLAYGPINEVTSHKGYIVNGYKFHTLAHGSGRVTNNTKVCVKGSCYNEEESDYYRELEEVIEVDYHSMLGTCMVVLFKCCWFDLVQGFKGLVGFVKPMPRGIFQVAEGILATEISNDDNVDGEEFFQENDRLVCTIGITEDIQQVTLIRKEIKEVQTTLVNDDTNDNGDEEEFEDMNGDDDSSDDIDLDSSNYSSDDDA